MRNHKESEGFTFFPAHLIMPLQSKVKQYTAQELDLGLISDKAYEVLGKRPFRWQLEAAMGVLCGQDVILDIGTGSGKTLCFSLPLLLNEKDLALTISPLTALMIDQVSGFYCLYPKSCTYFI